MEAEGAGVFRCLSPTHPPSIVSRVPLSSRPQAHDQLDAEQRGAQVQARALEEQAAELAAHIAAARQAHEQERAKRQRLSNDAKAKGALLAQVKSKPDPLAQAPALQRQLDKLADDLLQV